MRRAAHWLLVVAVLSASASCGGPDSDPDSSTGPRPQERALRLETTSCGPASGHFGSGVFIGDGLAVTVAHLIARAGSVEASLNGAPGSQVEVAAVDLEGDLAVLRLPEIEMPDVETAVVDEGALGHVVDGAASGTVPFEVKRRVNLTIEEILGTERHARLGYELSASTGDGDSGAGAYDDQGRLIGIVFATGEDGDTTWLTASSEIMDFVAGVGPTDKYALCP